MKVISSEFHSNFDQCVDLALREPLAITRDGSEWLTLISLEEYTSLVNANRRSQGLEGLTVDEVEELNGYGIGS